MISINRYNSRHPYPWYRVKSFESIVMGLIRGPSRSSSTIESNVSAVTKSHYDALDKLRADRMATLISAFISTALKAYRLYSGTSFASKHKLNSFSLCIQYFNTLPQSTDCHPLLCLHQDAISTTEDPSKYFLSDKLYYPHMALKCKYGVLFGYPRNCNLSLTTPSFAAYRFMQLLSSVSKFYLLAKSRIFSQNSEVSAAGHFLSPRARSSCRHLDGENIDLGLSFSLREAS